MKLQSGCMVRVGAALYAGWVLLSVEGVWSQAIAKDEGGCSPVLFVFGASLMDVGENAVAMPLRSSSEFRPYGLDYPHGPGNRYSNGRLIIDHISEALGQGLTKPYLRDAGTNFASSGATAGNKTLSGDGSRSSGLFSLLVQISQFRVLKSLAIATANSGGEHLHLPKPMDFAEGIYIFEIANNDYIQYDYSVPALTFVSGVIHQIETAIKMLYDEGAMTIITMNAFPGGCLPQSLAREAHTPDQLDEDGCLASLNQIISLHNTQLKVMMARLRTELPSANLIIFDLHTIYMDAIRNPARYGLKYVKRACCGYGGGKYNSNPDISCAFGGYLDGVFVTATFCDDRSSYMLWDNVHPTDAFAGQVANAFVSGKHFEPRFLLPVFNRTLPCTYLS